MSENTTTATGSRWLALVVLCAGQLMIILDGSIVNVALPVIQRDLGFSQASLAWVVNAYLIAFGGLLLLSGRLGDLIGRNRIFLAGLVVFTASSFVCGLAVNAPMLIVARFVQGVGGAMSSAVVLGMIVTMFSEEHERAKAIGVFSFVAAAGASIGLLLGGILTQGISWHWIFFINVPIGIAAAVLATRLFAAERGIGLAAGADALGAVLVTGGLMVGVYSIVSGADHGWTSQHTLGFGALAVVMLVCFVVRQATAAIPLLPLRIFRSRQVSGANLVQVLMVAGMFGFQFLGALYLQRVLLYGPADTGFAYLPVAITIAVLSLGFSARLSTRFGARPVLLAGLLLTMASLLLFARVPVDGNYPLDLLPVMLLLGAGAGLALPSAMNLAMSDATPEDSGLASGLVNTTQQVGGAVGLAVLATIATSRSDRLVGDGQSLPAALTAGYHLAFLAAAGFAAAAILVAMTVLGGGRGDQRSGDGPAADAEPSADRHAADARA